MSKVFIKRKTSEEIERDKIVADIDDIGTMIQNAYDRLNIITDEALIESTIYEIASLEAKYKYLILLAKSKGITVNAKRSILVPSIIDLENAIT
jgi:hypothetical protein